LSRFFDSVINRYKSITNESLKTKNDYNENLLKWYMKGFNDELKGSSTIESENKIEMIAYKLGAQHAIIGDDVSSIDNLSNEEIISMIKSKNK
jgi:high-affinity nickel permease